MAGSRPGALPRTAIKRRPDWHYAGAQHRTPAQDPPCIECRADLVFDEPLSNLDLKLREHMRVELKLIQHEIGITSIYVTTACPARA
jgi:iron(III) transport system ATP-binding protein